MNIKKTSPINDVKFTESRFNEHNKKQLLERLVPTRLEEIERLADAVRKVLPDRGLAFSVNLCLEELISNTITYGLNGATDHFVLVQINQSDEWLEILLKDDAPKFDPFVQAPEPQLDLDINERPVGGLGVHLVKKIMDDVQAYYDGSGNLIVLRKHLHDQEME